MPKTIDLQKYKENYLQFIESRNTLILSMLDADGRPFSSCAPFVKKAEKLYIFISRIADHYQLIEKSEYIDVLMLADESATTNKFATERARWSCIPKNIGLEGHEDIFALFHATYGEKMIEMLRGLDFSLFELTPLQGRYVVGFGLAFDTDINAKRFDHVVVDKKQEVSK